MIATTDALRPRATIVVLRPATRGATGRLAVKVRPAASALVRLREATGGVHKARARLPATTADRDRASGRGQAAPEVSRGATIAVRRDLSPLAKATDATRLRAIVIVIVIVVTARARVENVRRTLGASAVVPTATASDREDVTEASALPVGVTEASVRRRLRVRVTAVLPPAAETVDRVRRRTLPRADRSAKAGTARREGPTSAPRTIPRVDRTRAPRSRGRLLRRVTCRASLPCCRGRKSGES